MLLDYCNGECVGGIHPETCKVPPVFQMCDGKAHDG